MTAHQMIRHVGDACRMGSGEVRVSDATGLAQRTVIKWIALYTPLRWPRRHFHPSRNRSTVHQRRCRDLPRRPGAHGVARRCLRRARGHTRLAHASDFRPAVRVRLDALGLPAPRSSSAAIRALRRRSLRRGRSSPSPRSPLLLATRLSARPADRPSSRGGRGRSTPARRRRSGRAGRSANVTRSVALTPNSSAAITRVSAARAEQAEHDPGDGQLHALAHRPCRRCGRAGRPAPSARRSRARPASPGTTSRRRRRSTASSSANSGERAQHQRREPLPRHRVATSGPSSSGRRTTGSSGRRSWIARAIGAATAAGSDDVRATCSRAMPARRPIDDDAAVDVEAVLLDRADDADDGHLALGIEPDVLADRIPVRPEPPRELLVDDRHRLRVRHRCRTSVKDRPLTQRNLHRPEIVRSWRARWSTCSSWPGCGVNPSTLIDPQPTDDVNGSDDTAPRTVTPGTAAMASPNLAEELDGGVADSETAGALAPSRIEITFSGLKPGGTRLQPHEAANQQAGADQQHQRQRQLGDDEQAAQAQARGAEAAVALRASSAGLERGVESTRAARTPARARR